MRSLRVRAHVDFGSLEVRIDLCRRQRDPALHRAMFRRDRRTSSHALSGQVLIGEFVGSQIDIFRGARLLRGDEGIFLFAVVQHYKLAVSGASRRGFRIFVGWIRISHASNTSASLRKSLPAEGTALLVRFPRTEAAIVAATEGVGKLFGELCGGRW